MYEFFEGEPQTHISSLKKYEFFEEIPENSYLIAEKV